MRALGLRLETVPARESPRGSPRFYFDLAQNLFSPYPFPISRLGVRLSQYPNAEVVWCQEEPENMGAWTFVDRRIEKTLRSINHKAARPRYVGRHEMAATATGLLRRHNQEQAALVEHALV